jgi:hypothetical protein
MDDSISEISSND